MADTSGERIRRLEKEKARLGGMLEASAVIGAISRLDDLADFVADEALRLTGAQKSSLMVIDDAARELVFRGGRGPGQERLRGARVKVGERVAGLVAAEGKALVVDDADEFFTARQGRSRDGYKTKSFVSVPLKSGGRTVGVMNVTDKLAPPGVFNDEDLESLRLLGRQAAAQIEDILVRERLSSLAVTDELTGIFNRRYFEEQLARELLRCRRYGGDLGLVMLDIDGFKTFNDRYGHIEGDLALRHVAEAVKGNIRTIDTPCRYGGDEFCVIFPSTGLEGAAAAAQKIRRAVEKSEFAIKGEKIKITISGGAAAYAEGKGREEIVSLADRLLYKAKSGGGNMICVPGK